MCKYYNIHLCKYYNIHFKLLNFFGNHRISCALAMGALLAFAFAPFNFFPIFFFVIPVLYHTLEKKESINHMFLIGFFFCTGLNIIHFSWGVYLAQNHFVGIFKNEFIVVCSSIFSTFLFLFPTQLLFGLFFVLYGFLKNFNFLPSSAHPYLFGAILLLCEFFFGFPYENGFPWFKFGYALSNTLIIAQIAAVGGIFLLSLFIITCSCLLIRPSKPSVLLFIVLFLSAISFGSFRLINTKTSFEPKKPIRLVQAQIPANFVLKNSNKIKSINQYLMLSKDPSKYNEALTIWPEMSVPVLIKEEKAILKHIHNSANPEILIGTIDRAFDKKSNKYLFFNAAALINKQTTLVPIVHKNYLVPFAEYSPCSSIFPKLSRKILGNRDYFNFGKTGKILKSNIAGDIIILNCYEVLFPHLTKMYSKESDAIINISNDAYFAGTFADSQILAISRIRAIETNLPLIRATNKGINAMFDGYGRILLFKKSDIPEVYEFLLPNKI